MTGLVAVLTCLNASETDSAFVRAGRLYGQNDFTGAAAQYQTLIDSGWASATLFYNMGNACFKNHDIKAAILYYERARRLAPNDEDIERNLQLSRSLIFDKVEAMPELFLITWAKNLRDLCSERLWSYLSIGGFLLTLLSGLGFLFLHRRTFKKTAFSTGILFLLLSIGALTLGYLQKTNVEREDEAIVFAPSVTVKSSPDNSGNNLFVIHEGIKVQITDQIGEWCEIRIADGNRGWMRAKDLTII
ncbi:MAG: tetratricopeptide repeat protein [Bacteroidales bacterium]|jgi:tetratricopeptide (TPR) repeat protein|nr:tetratricopeptide repeat protein [Bacteroidales bacterium]